MGELPDTPFCCPPRLNLPKGGAGGRGLPVHPSGPPSPSPTLGHPGHCCSAQGLSLPIHQMDRGLWKSWPCGRGRGRDTLSVLPLSPTPFFRLPLGCESSTHSGACATLWLLSPPLHPLWGAPGCPKPPNTTHIPPAAQLSGQSPRHLPGEGQSCAFLSLLRTSGTPAPRAEQPNAARTQTPPTLRGQPGKGPQGWCGWTQGQGGTVPTVGHPGNRVQALGLTQRPLCGHWGRHYTSQDASLCGPPSFPLTTPAARFPPLFHQPIGGGRGGGAQMWLLGAGRWGADPI